MATRASIAKGMKKHGIARREAHLCLDAVVEEIVASLSAGESLQIRGLGTFSVQAVREKRYPSSLSENKTVAAHGRVAFKPCDKLRRAVWNTRKN